MIHTRPGSRRGGAEADNGAVVLLVLLAIVVSAVLGAAALVAVWPVLVVGVAVLYCLDRPARRKARLTIAAVMVVGAIGYELGPWDVSPGSATAVYCFALPLVAAASVVLVSGGPRRIRARHARAEAERRRRRAYAAEARRQARRAGIKRRTGLDVDVLAAATADRGGRWVRAAGKRLTRRTDRRGAVPQDDTASAWLDLDRDVAADLSRQRSEEIRRLADELDRTRTTRSG